MLLPIYQDHETFSTQSQQELAGVTGDALCMTWRLSILLLLLLMIRDDNETLGESD